MEKFKIKDANFELELGKDALTVRCELGHKMYTRAVKHHLGKTYLEEDIRIVNESLKKIASIRGKTRTIDDRDLPIPNSIVHIWLAKRAQDQYEIFMTGEDFEAKPTITEGEESFPAGIWLLNDKGLDQLVRFLEMYKDSLTERSEE